LDPTILILREAVNQLETESVDSHSKEKLEELLDVLDTASSIYKEVQKIPTKSIVRIAKMSDIVSRILRLPQEK
jgi:hypothetical protein